MRSRFEQFTFIISGIQRDIQKIERDEMVKYGYKGAYAQYLVAIHGHPEGLTSGQLCEACDKDKAAVSRVIAEMEQRGLVARDAAEDRVYRARIRLTEEGLKAARFVDERATAAVLAAGKGLTDENRAVFYEALNLIAGNLQILSRDGIPEDANPISQ